MNSNDLPDKYHVYCGIIDLLRKHVKPDAVLYETGWSFLKQFINETLGKFPECQSFVNGFNNWNWNTCQSKDEVGKINDFVNRVQLYNFINNEQVLDVLKRILLREYDFRYIETETKVPETKTQ
jgi:hypothetical protein